MKLRSTHPRNRRKGQALVEYALLIAGIALVSVVAIALLGHKSMQVIGVMAGIMPAAHIEDNKPIADAHTIPLNVSGSTITLDSAGLVSSAGVDRMVDLLGAHGGESLIIASE